MPDLSALAAQWDAVYNGPRTAPAPGYILVSVLRVLIAVAAWQMLRALGRYLAAAFPPPHTAANALYWLRWWTWLRLREHRTLKIGTVLVALLLVLQIPAGAAGALAGASLYLLLIYPAQVAVLLGVARLLNSLTRRIEHPAN